MNRLDITKHSLPTKGILNWILWFWNHEPSLQIVIVVPPGIARSMDQRIRTKLSNIRAAMDKNKIQYVQFGMESSYIDWTDEDGTTSSAICYQRVVYPRHTFDEAMRGANLGDKING